jgi:hypothetical protein
MADKTWSDLQSFGESILLCETAAPNLTLLKSLANEGINEISGRIKNVYRSWSNAVDGGLTLTTNTFNLPTDMLKFTSVIWDGTELVECSEAELDSESNDWRTRTGIPCRFVRAGRAVMLDFIPEGTATGKLVVWGYGSLPLFSDAQGAENPLASIPAVYQMAPVYYALREYPVDPQSAMSVARQAKYAERWELSLANIVESANTLGREIFTY